MTTEQKRILLQELYQADMTRPQLERYLASNLRLSPPQWMDMVKDIQGTIDDPENDSQDKPVQDSLNTYLEEKFPE
jgi:hypothetical protein